MIQKRSTRHMIIAAVMTAVGIVLPIAFHSIPDAGKIFLPMHLPVMIAAMFLPWTWAAAVGLLTPILSTFLTGMPPLAPFPMAIIMPFELATYAIIISLLRKKLVSTDKWYSPLFAVIPAMIAGRIVAGGVLFALLKIYLPMKISPIIFVLGGITTGIPGIIIQIIIVPILYHVLARNLKWYNKS
ncbi:MAG: ECF transporter S component [Clostridiales bacterium]|nr:ECF transporter S component [Clostridiales bacterium]